MMGNHGKKIDEFLARRLKALFASHRKPLDVDAATAKIMARLAKEKQSVHSQSHPYPWLSLRWAGATAAAIAVVVMGIVTFDIQWTPVTTDTKPQETEVIAVTDEPYQAPIAPQEATQHPANQPTPVLAETADRQTVHLAQAEVIDLAGRVLDEAGLPVSATVSYQSTQNTSLTHSTVCPDGTFQFQAIPKDVYIVTAYTDDTLADRATLDRSRSDITLSPAKRGRLSVAIQSGPNSPSSDPNRRLSGFTVSLQSAPGNPHLIAMEASVDENGAAEFQDLPKGTYLLSARYNEITDERYTVKTTIDTFYKQESAAVSLPAALVAGMNTIERWQSLPADLAVAATYTCSYQHPPVGNREYAERAARVRYQDPKSIFYGLCTDEEIEQWIDTVIQPYQEQVTVVLTWTSGSYGFEIIRGPEKLPATFDREYIGGDTQRRVHWYSLNNVNSFYVNSHQIEGQFNYLPVYYPNCQSVLAPFSLFTPETFHVDRIEREERGWDYAVVSDSIQALVPSALISSTIDATGHQTVSSIRYTLQDTPVERKWVEVYFDRYRDVAENILLPEHIIWLTRTIPETSQTNDLHLANEMNPQTDIRMELEWIDGQCGPLPELFSENTILPKVPVHSTFDDLRYRNAASPIVPPEPFGDYRFSGP